MSGYNTSSEACSSHVTDASRDNTEAGDNQSVMSSDRASNQSRELENGHFQEVSLNKLRLVILDSVNS